MKYKLIKRTFPTLKAAERYLSGLYAKHDSVRCISWPSFGESGTYTFECID